MGASCLTSASLSGLSTHGYTLLDTEQLLREAKEAPGHSHAEAIMILDHKRAFDYIWTHQADFRQLTRRRIEQVHELLIQDLGIPRGLRTTTTFFSARKRRWRTWDPVSTRANFTSA